MRCRPRTNWAWIWPPASSDPVTLAGTRVLVTRPRRQTHELSRALRSRGAEVVAVPLVGLRSRLPARAREALGSEWAAESFDHVAVTSARTVELVGAALRAVAERGTQITAVGPATASALAAAGIATAMVPASSRADALADALIGAGVQGRRVLLPGAADATPTLAMKLRAAGAEVVAVTLYDTVLPRGAGPRIAAAFGAGVDVVTLASGSAARNLFRCMVENDLSPHSARLVCIGPMTAAVVEELGLEVAAVAAHVTTAAMVEAVMTAIGSKGH